MSLTSFDRERMEFMHDRGYSAQEIATAIGCTSRTVTRWRKSTGRSAPTPQLSGTRISADRLAKAAQMLADGASQRDTARTLGMTHHTLRRHFPDAKWGPQESAVYARAVRTLNALPSDATALRTHLSEVA